MHVRYACTLEYMHVSCDVPSPIGHRGILPFKPSDRIRVRPSQQGIPQKKEMASPRGGRGGRRAPLLAATTAVAAAALSVLALALSPAPAAGAAFVPARPPEKRVAALPLSPAPGAAFAVLAPRIDILTRTAGRKTEDGEHYLLLHDYTTWISQGGHTSYRL